jgi:putative transposase
VGRRLDKIRATRKRHSPEQIVRKPMGPDRLLAEGNETAAVCRGLGVSEATYHRWRNQFGGLKAEDAKPLKDLERENATLKRLLAEAELGRLRSRRPQRETSKPGTPAANPDRVNARSRSPKRVVKFSAHTVQRLF